MLKKIFFILLIINTLQSCKVNYSFTGINVSKDIKTFEVDYMPNSAPYIVPGMNEDFRNMLIDRIDSQTSLTQVKSDGDIIFQGEITDYHVEPVALTAGQTAAQNRLTIAIKIDYINNKNEEENVSKTYSWYKDYSANLTREDVAADAHKKILETILDNIFSDTLAKW